MAASHMGISSLALEFGVSWATYTEEPIAFAAQTPRSSYCESKPITSLHIIVWDKPSVICLGFVPLPRPIFHRPRQAGTFCEVKCVPRSTTPKTPALRGSANDM